MLIASREFRISRSAVSSFFGVKPHHPHLVHAMSEEDPDTIRAL